VITINLLPVREWRKRENVRRQFSIFVLSLILLGCILFAAGASIQAKVALQRQELNQLEDQKRKLAYVNKKIQTVRAKEKEVEEKFKAIEQLQQGRTRTVKILDDIASSIPLDRVWLDRLSLKGKTLSLSGTALDNHTVALFMQRLESTPVFSKVYLKNTKSINYQGHKLMKFDLSINIAQ